MRPFEEYYKRHKIDDVPVVYHCSTGSLILQTTDFSQWKNKWMLVSINWIPHDLHPGQYQIEINSPIHDGYKQENIFSKRSPLFKKWHQYEDFLLDWTENLRGVKAVQGIKNITLVAWEMFVFVYDSWFLKQPNEIKKLLFESLDKENTIENRINRYLDVGIYLSTHHPAIIRVWKYEILSRLQHYADWLAKIMEDKNLLLVKI